jgi:hypothetical protein
MSFDAVACTPGPLTGGSSFDAGEYANASPSFEVKIGNGGVPATLYWTNDCDNVYLALVVQTQDALDPGDADGEARFFAINDSWGVFEVVHPLKSDDPEHNTQLELGDATGFFVVVQQGNGAKGNTEWPGFRVWQTFDITP